MTRPDVGLARFYGLVTGASFHDFRLRSACLEPVAVIASLEDVTVEGEPIEQGCGHLGVAEHLAPFREAEVCGDGEAGALVELAEQMEQ